MSIQFLNAEKSMWFVSLRNVFVAAVQGEKRVAKYLGPPKDPAYHLEIPQPEKS